MAEYGALPAPWQSLPIICKGGLDLSSDALSQGTAATGSAIVLQNFEPALEGGYRRISGYSLWDQASIPGDINTPVLGVQPALGRAFGVRYSTTLNSNDIYQSFGSGWTKINLVGRPGVCTKARMIPYSITKPVVVGTDGQNTAWKYDGTTFTDINSAGAPLNPQYAEMFLARLVLSGYSSNTSAISLSAPNDDEDFSGASGAIEINVGDVVVGLKNFRSTLYIFCKNSIFKLIGSTSADFQIEPVTSAIGCISGDTIQETGGDLIYLAPDGFRSVAGTAYIGDVDLSLQSRAIQPIVRDLLSTVSITNWCSCPVRIKSQYRCWFYDLNASEDDAVGVIGKLEPGAPIDSFNNTYTKYVWSVMVGIKPYCSASYYDANTERVLFGHYTDGCVYQMEVGDSFNGRDISAIYKSPFITFNDVTLRKVMQKIDLFTQIEGSSVIDLGLKFDYENTGILQPASVPFVSSASFAVYGSGIYDTSVYAGVQFPVFKQNLIGSGFTTAFEFTSIGGAPYRIDSFAVTFGLKGRR